MYFLRMLALLLGSTFVASAQPNPMTPFEFAEKIRAAGGRVDFVFGAKRPFPQCHASSVEQAANGDLISVWFAGTEERSPDVGIWTSRFTGGKWSEPSILAKINETAHWNPVLFREGDMLYLFFKVGPRIPKWETYWMQSADSGTTWSTPVELVPGDHGGRGPVRSKPIILSDGTWLAPASSEDGPWVPFADRSVDQGKTWERSENFVIDPKVLSGLPATPSAPAVEAIAEPKAFGAIQPTLWESEPGKVHALLRSTGGRIWRSDSSDGGLTWTPVYATELPNNNSGIETLKLEDGRLLLLYNPVSKNWGNRTPLDLAVSADNGQTWRTIAHLEQDPDLESEFSYPSMARTKDGIAITYTYQRERLRCWQVPLTVLE